MKVRRWVDIDHTNTKQKQSSVVILTPTTWSQIHKNCKVRRRKRKILNYGWIF